MRPSSPRYVTRQGFDLAWHEFGSGPRELLMIWGAPNHIESLWDWHTVADFLRDLGSLGRVVEYDTRGTGLSSKVSLDELASTDEHAEDALAIMDAAGMSKPVVVAETSAAPIGVTLAARHPQRVERLVLLSPNFAGLLSDELVPVVLDVIETRWGEPFLVEVVFPSLASDPRYVEWYARHTRMAATPSAARALVEMDQRTDVTGLLPDVGCPTLVLRRQHDEFLNASEIEGQARTIPDCRLVTTPGRDHTYGVGEGDAEALAAIREFLGSAGAEPGIPHQVDATVVFTDIVGSTRRAALLGDESWRAVLNEHDRCMAETIDQSGGELIETTGDGILALFREPDAAIDAMLAANRRLEEHQVEIRTGMHTGSVFLRGDGISGMTVHIASRINQHATAGEILVSEATARKLTTGWQTSTRGTFELKGVEEPVTLFSVQPRGAD